MTDAEKEIITQRESAFSRGYKKGRTDVVDEAEAKINEYASVWMSYTDGMTKEQIAQEALNTAKAAMIKILGHIKEQKDD